LPEAVGEPIIFGGEDFDLQALFVELQDHPKVLHHAGDSDDQVGESISADCAFFGIGDVFILASPLFVKLLVSQFTVN
jgi:hypothetical protein